MNKTPLAKYYKISDYGNCLLHIIINNTFVNYYIF